MTPKQQKSVFVSLRMLPALVTADHGAIVVGEATDAAGDVGPVAPIL